MEVLFLTVFLSLILAVSFILLFLRQRQMKGSRGFEREALMPLEEEGPPPQRKQCKKPSRQ